MEARLEWNQVAGRCPRQGVGRDEERMEVAVGMGKERIFERNIPEVEKSRLLDNPLSLFLPQQAFHLHSS